MSSSKIVFECCFSVQNYWESPKCFYFHRNEIFHNPIFFLAARQLLNMLFYIMKWGSLHMYMGQNNVSGPFLDAMEYCSSTVIMNMPILSLKKEWKVTEISFWSSLRNTEFSKLCGSKGTSKWSWLDVYLSATI